jgi:hypothetical protein
MSKGGFAWAGDWYRTCCSAKMEVDIEDEEAEAEAEGMECWWVVCCTLGLVRAVRKRNEPRVYACTGSSLSP